MPFCTRSHLSNRMCLGVTTNCCNGMWLLWSKNVTVMAVSAALALQKLYRSACPWCQIGDKRSEVDSSTLQVCKLKSFITCAHCWIIMKKKYDEQEIAWNQEAKPHQTRAWSCVTIDSISLQHNRVHFGVRIGDSKPLTAVVWWERRHKSFFQGCYFSF